MSPVLAHEGTHVLVVGRSPSVLVGAVDLLRANGYVANATNQFEQVLERDDVDDLDILVFGGMVPPDTKQHLREEIARRNPAVTFIQGLAGIAGVIAAQVEALSTAAGGVAEIEYDGADRTLRIRLIEDARVTVEAFWLTSFKPPEPTSTSVHVYDGDLAAGSHEIGLPEHVPTTACFAKVTVGSQVRVHTIGAMPQAVTRMAPTSASDRRLPEVAPVTTKTDGRRGESRRRRSP